MNEHLTEGLELANSVKVYLDWNDNERRWECAPVTMDGAPLDGHGEVEGDLDRRYWTAEDQAAADRANLSTLPTGAELIKLMADYLPGDTLDAVNNAAVLVKRAAEGDSNDEEIGALQNYVELLENILGFNWEEQA